MLSPAQFREIVSGRTAGLGPACLRGLLAAAEPVYGAVVKAKNRRFDAGHTPTVRVAAPVISVGNLTVGGTGKTPLVAWLAEWFRTQGMAVTIISRGYGATHGRPNDEALELAARLPDVPHLQNPDRVAAAQQALATNPRQVLILDDAFQHRRLARDLDIVLLDALEPFGHDRLLPRGLLREPVASLARADVVALSRADAIDDATRQQIRQRASDVAPQALWLELAHHPTGFVNSSGQRLALEALRGESVAAFCGIGNPAGFRHTLENCGLRVKVFRALDDHCAYSADEIARLAAWIENGGEKGSGVFGGSSLPSMENFRPPKTPDPLSPDPVAVICTRKDLVKIPRETLGGKPLWALAIQLAISSGEAELIDRLGRLSAAGPRK
jgi:tetraacyldisaccharide 4'-kinase